ncbi:MAG: hypothetical protein ACLFQY_21000, partial [Desulfococcaceae bacterium]
RMVFLLCAFRSICLILFSFFFRIKISDSVRSPLFPLDPINIIRPEIEPIPAPGQVTIKSIIAEPAHYPDVNPFPHSIQQNNEIAPNKPVDFPERRRHIPVVLYYLGSVF